MIEELSLHKEIDAFKELRHLRMINHRYIEQSIIRHGIWRLPIARCITDTHGHHPTLNHIRIDMDVHLVIQTLENHQDERKDERQGSGAEGMMSLASQVHDIGNEAHIDTVQEIADTLIPLLVGISDAPQVYLSMMRRFMSQLTVCSILLSSNPQK